MILAMLIVGLTLAIISVYIYDNVTKDAYDLD